MINILTFYIGISFLIFFSYNLGWSYKYPDIDLLNYLVDFYFVILILPTYFMIKKQKFEFKKIKISKQIYSIIIFNIVEMLYVGKVPLIEILLKTGYFYRDYRGIPTFHVLLFQWNIYLSVLSGYNLLISKSKKTKFEYLLSILPFILLYSRFAIIFSLLSTLNIYIYLNRKKIFRKIVPICLIGLLCSYMFGVIGNMRNGSSPTDNRMILSVGGATEEFKEGIIPKEYFWTYSYLTSSLANFQKTILEKKPLMNEKDFILYALIPDIFSKKLGANNREKFIQISTALNGAPDITFSYLYFGWIGVYVFLFLKALFINIYIYIVLNGKMKYKLVNLSVLICFVFFNFINNMFIYGGFILIPIYAMIYSLKKVKINYKNKERIKYAKNNF